ncbi:MAG: MBL fold metallo-hydrolase [Candidatus Muirbacterium halophilum]|nr:MBL fold metallo-hydrolase [Candidatus Muirbacterium halophilum]MCK9475981.1 MBL fold metallo-hydrolase [Candidatus Muirbacterium halophilum]
MLSIKWYGHSCFVIKYNDFSIVTDPFDSCVNYKLPIINPDIITVSHYHGDHSEPEFLKKAPVIDQNNLIYNSNNINITGIKSYHDENMGKERGENTIFHFKIQNNISIIHLGDLGCKMPKISDIAENLIILAPFGGFFTIDGNKSLEIAQKLKAKYLIPMHYKTDKVDFELKKLSDYNFEFIKKDIIEINNINDFPTNLEIIELSY